jgi:chaperone modulatory protein CbpM
MQTEMIVVNEFCIHHEIDMEFINALCDAGLIEVIVSGDQVCIAEEELPRLEKMVRLHELDINPEGIETITYLLQKMSELQQQVHALNCRLQLYEAINER